MGYFSFKLRRKARVAIAVAVSAIAIGSAYGAQTNLLLMTWGGVFTESQSKAFFAPFMSETGIKITPVTPVSMAKMKASVKLGTYEADVSSIAEYDFYQAIAENILEPIDYSIVKKGSAPAEMFSQHGVASHTISYQLVYNSKSFPNGGPQSWADFWDVKKFPGSRSLYNAPVANIEFALLADGVAKKDIYPLDDAKIKRAFAKLDQIKPHIKIWWAQGSQSQQIFKDGEIDLMMMWNGRATDLKAQGVPIVQVWKDAGISVNQWIVLKGSPRKDVAMRFISASIDPKREAVLSQALHYGSLNPETLKHLTAEQVAVQPTSPEHMKAGFRVDSKWWGENAAKILPQWQSWLIK